MANAVIISDKMPSLFALEEAIVIHKQQAKLNDLMAFLTAYIENNPMSLMRAGELAYYVAYSNEFFKKDITENARMDMYNCTVNLTLDLEQALREYAFDFSTHLLVFKSVLKRGIVVEVQQRAPLS